MLEHEYCFVQKKSFDFNKLNAYKIRHLVSLSMRVNLLKETYFVVIFYLFAVRNFPIFAFHFHKNFRCQFVKKNIHLTAIKEGNIRKSFQRV